MDAAVAGTRADTVVARAKINLALHVVGRRSDGYHELESLVVFAEFGDRLAIAPAERDELRVDGPLAAGVPVGPSNLVLKALDLAREAGREAGVAIDPLAIRLTKHLPHAAGIGGGSADAGALLGWIVRRHAALRPNLIERAVRLGADVPMCLQGEAALVRGVGERGSRVSRMPPLHLVLVNPGVPVSTPAVFAALERRDGSGMPALAETGFAGLSELVAYLAATRNDLEPPARALAPAIADAATALDHEGACFTRMSGSGATVFGLFEDAGGADRAADAIARDHPRWWVQATRCVEQGTDTP